MEISLSFSLRLCCIFVSLLRQLAFDTAAGLPKQEVDALKEIAKELGKKDWNFDVDPCIINDSTWNAPLVAGSLYRSNLNCTCLDPSGECHVTAIYLKAQDLDGVLPPSIVKLPYLKLIDLARNYLTGTIPREWNSTHLESLSVSVNKLSGTIPYYLGGITTLKRLNLENNLFSGTIPPQLGNLVNLEAVSFSANNLTGVLPLTFTNLTKLLEFRISNNNFTGKIPNFFPDWKHLEKIEILGSGLDGPIPPSISGLINLTMLKISDLKGDQGSTFPNISSMSTMRYLMLRSCNISGQIPEYIANLAALEFFDLSFNRLEGEIPDLSGLTRLTFMYLTGNLLGGPIPAWIKNRESNYHVDLSYNNFLESSVPPDCRENINLYRCFSGQDKSILAQCMRDQCSEDKYSVHINCGGQDTKIGKIKYEGDQQQAGGETKFVPSAKNWGFSSTGQFWETKITPNDFIYNNKSILTMQDSELYTNARTSPLSLTYYARCLANGNYNVRLHFAEIVFRGNRSFHSLGRRVFDVYIQDELKVKDFNIEERAPGVDKAFIIPFKATVTNRNLEIHFRWAGKGTTVAPKIETYGPLISAISIESESPPPSESRTKLILGGTLGAVSLLCLISMVLLVLWWKGHLGSRNSDETDLKGLDVQTGMFSFRQIKSATNSFDPANKLGEGGFGAVYKGILSDGTIIAVKQLSSRSKQGNREFVNEIGMISGLHHPNLVKLYGCCVEGKELLLVYEYMENNSLSHSLFGPDDSPPKLDWPTRWKICAGIARGLAFLHEQSALKIIHRDIKTTNVLLDRNLNAKISDFGLAKLDEEDMTHISTRVAGTLGYMAPEYALWGYLTYKVDVYSFGVVALELVAGRNNTKFQSIENYFCLLDWALVLRQEGNLLEIADPRLGSDYNKEEALRMIKIALLCTNPSPALRPMMSEVVNMIEGQTAVRELAGDSGDEMRFKAFRGQFGQVHDEDISKETVTLLHSSMSIDSSSTS